MRIVIIIFISISLISCKKETKGFVKLKGNAFGTQFHITYFDENEHDFTKQIDSLFFLVNKSLESFEKYLTLRLGQFSEEFLFTLVLKLEKMG